MKRLEKKIIVKKGTLDDIEFPEVLYKYRFWGDEYHKRFITEREVFMASAKTFKDELDCHNPTRYDLLSDHQIYELYLWDSKKTLNPGFSRQQHREFARNWVKKSPLKDKEGVKIHMEKLIDEYYLHEGIFSLSENWDNDEMWTKYADNNRGFCIGYNTKELFKFIGGGGLVQYVDEIPIILPEPIMSFEEAMQNRVYKKEKKWMFEQEYRTKKFWKTEATINDRRIQLPQKVFSRIILGKDISVSDKNELIENIKEYIGDIEIITRNK